MLKEVTKMMEEFIAELGDDNVSNLYKSLPMGKQLRSKLILSIAKNSSCAIKLAAIVEMIHAASLLHDDVIDEANMRRGESSFNAKFGDRDAIMMGDVLYSYGFLKLVSFSKEIATSISYAVSMLSIGELNDVVLSSDLNTQKEKYLTMIYQKTASLIEASAKSAALLEGLNADDFALYGKNLGLAFQIIDDVLDITQDDETLGKPALNDLKEGKMTLPYIYMFEACTNDEREYFKTLYAKELDSDQKEWIKTRMHKYGSIQRCVDEARELGHEALRVIEKYKIDGLEKVIIQMIDRNF